MSFSDSDTISYFQFQSPAAEMKQAIFLWETCNTEWSAQGENCLKS